MHQDLSLKMSNVNTGHQTNLTQVRYQDGTTNGTWHPVHKEQQVAIKLYKQLTCD